MVLADLIERDLRVAVVGLAKNTGKTETLNALLRELGARGRTVGVTSVGRDGEARDAIDARIEKPRVRLAAGSLLATTDALLRASALAYEPLENTGMRTPLGRVVLVRLAEQGMVEVAGPSAACEVREVADAMLDHGAEQVLIDGAIDRRAASSPEVCDGLVVATGAVLGEREEEVVAATRAAIDLVRLPEPREQRVRRLASERPGSLVLTGPGEEPVAIGARWALRSAAPEIAELLRASPGASHLVLRGAVCEPFPAELLRALRGRPLELVVQDSTRLFLGERGCAWYERQGLAFRVLAPIGLRAVTVNPVAPRSHAFDAGALRAALADALPEVTVVDVRRGPD
ncbi:MAG TPA: hypothetical protein VMU32_02330 [Solirubrobacteraceae bacterium]|nr:hypothetical protein [Solirubrobacteraceae bacterium]